METVTHIDSAMALVSRARKPWPNITLVNVDALPGEEDERVIYGRESPREVEQAIGRPLSLGLMLTDQSDAAFAAFWLRRARREDMRGQPLPPASESYYVVRCGTPTAERSSIVGWGRKGWVFHPRDRESGIATSGRRGLYDHLSLMPGIAFWLHYTWQAKFLVGNGYVVVPTNPAGIVDLFRTRDAPLTEGGRRAALLHWVQAHRRTSSRGTVHDVRKHLRGARSFAWRGWQVALAPSAADEAKFCRGSSRGSAPPDAAPVSQVPGIIERANGLEPSTFSLGSKLPGFSEAENAENAGDLMGDGVGQGDGK